MDVIENIPLCQAISEFLEMLENKGCIIVDKKISDYHFHELSFKVSCKKMESISNNHALIINKNGSFLCKCHWSLIEIV